MTQMYDRNGNPISITDFTSKFADADYKSVACHYMQDWMISTVWLGISHGETVDGRPLIFETMIFPPDTYEDYYCTRYATEEEARSGHYRAMAWLANNRLGPDSIHDIRLPRSEEQE